MQLKKNDFENYWANGFDGWEKRLRAYAVAYSTMLPWEQWPTLAELARKYKVKQDDILEFVENDSELDLIVGARVNGGVGSYEQGDYRVEYYGDLNREKVDLIFDSNPYNLSTEHRGHYDMYFQ